MKSAVIISCFDWYKARQEPIREHMQNNGYSVHVFISDFDHLKKTKLEIVYPQCTYIHVPKYKKNISARRLLSHFTFAIKVHKYLKLIKPDLIYIQTPPNIVSYIAGKYKQDHSNTILFVDVVDLWPESMPIGNIKNGLIGRLWASLRNKGLTQADCVITECDLYHRTISNIVMDKKPVTLRLFKELSADEKEEILKAINDKPNDDRIIKLAFLGSMNSLIDIKKIVSVITELLLSGNQVELHAIGDGISRKEFEENVNRTGCKSFFYGKVFDELEKIRILAHCDYALNIMRESVEVGLTIKSIDYMSYGLPLINNIKGDTWDIVDKYKLGINIASVLSQGDLNLREQSFDHMAIWKYYSDNFTKEAFVLNAHDILSKYI